MLNILRFKNLLWDEVVHLLNYGYNKRYDEEDEENIEETLDDALKQIEDKKYDTELIKRGVK